MEVGFVASHLPRVPCRGFKPGLPRITCHSCLSFFLPPSPHPESQYQGVLGTDRTELPRKRHPGPW